jgi:thioredoxin 1
MPTVELTDDNFEALVLRASGAVLVDFWATWCAPCKMVAPILEELSETYAGGLTIGKLDVDAAPRVAQLFRIQSIPTLVLFENGRPIQAVQGALPKEALVELIEKNVSGLEPRTIPHDQLAARLAAEPDIRIFDLRDPRDVSRSHLRHARAVALADLPAEIAAAATPVVLVCRTGEISAEAAKEHGGRVEVVALEKGLLEWEGAGHPTYNDAEEAELDGGAG